MKKIQGITLVSLVITVVVMLILAGVTISVFTGTDGMFSSITQATREYKKQAMLEAVDLAKAYVELDKTYTNEPITITDVIDKIKEVSTINEKDYIITVDDEEQTATIIDKATGVVVDVWIDENGHIQSDGNIVDDVENLVKPTVTYELDPPAGTYGDEVKITITATEEKNGIVRMVLPDNSEIIYNKEKEVTKEYIVTENGTYTFVVEGANGRKTTKYVEVKNITSAANIVMEVQNTEPTNQPVNVLITYDENVKMGGQVLVNADRFQYSIGENNWQNASSANTTIQVGVNGTVYARYYSGTEGFGTTSVTIQNIDKIGPNTFDLSTTKTTNSITVSGSTEDTGTTGCAAENYGIRGYQFQLKDSAGSVITSWTTETTATSYTFNNLTQGTTYKVSMRAIDKAGNITEATNKDESVTLSTTPDSSTAIGITYNPTTPTTGNVQVTFTNNSGQSGLTLKYQIGSQTGTWTTYTGPVTMTTNGKVYARLFDANNQYTNTATANVDNIDREKPVISSATASTSWGAKNSVTITATDTGTEGCATENIGIVGYGINKSSTTEPTYTPVTATTSLSTTINNITANGTYYVWVKDQAGNTANKPVTVNRVDTTAPTTATIASSNVEAETFTLTATGADGESGISKYEFYINNTLEKTVTTTAGSATYNVTGKTGSTTYTCYVKVYDAAGKSKTSSSITVTTQSLVGKWDGTICTPNVSEGMTKVYWNGSDEIVEGDADYVESEWYDYKEQTSKTPNGGTSKWANVKMSDGSYFVWIPRYEYKFLSGEGTSTAGVIDINFISTEKTTPTAGYTIHPAFTNSAPNGGGFGEIPGLWVAKFEASHADASSSSEGTSSKIKIQPNVQSWRSIKIGDIYTKALNYDTTSINNSEFDSHLMKNSEWGAVAYLAWSKYGRNGTEITINNSSSYITGNAGNSISDTNYSSGTTNAWNTSKGMLASTTGNASGIYDMSGGAYEYVAAYVANGNSRLSDYGSSFASTSVTSNSASTKYVTVYPKGSSDSQANNWNAYKALTDLRGDAMKETASSYSGSASWNGDYSYFPCSSYPFFVRGGFYNDGSNAGAFCFYYGGGAYSNYGFRVVGL